MNIVIPAKTFLVGEYLALTGGPSIILTTTPCFELRKCNNLGLHGVHPESPAGRLWAQYTPKDLGLNWHDPYHGLGGMGASSAEFLGVYRAINSTDKIQTNQLLDAYTRTAYHGRGLAPSGYDVLAQNSHECVFIDNKQHTASYAWPFEDLAFILAHTRKKIATHQHLETFETINQTAKLTKLVMDAQQSFINKSSQELVDSVNAYYQTLLELDLVAPHTQKIIQQLRSETDLLAAKGCGALGADIILLIVPASQQKKWQKEIIPNYLLWIAGTNELYSNHTAKILDISI